MKGKLKAKCCSLVILLCMVVGMRLTYHCTCWGQHMHAKLCWQDAPAMESGPQYLLNSAMNPSTTVPARGIQLPTPPRDQPKEGVCCQVTADLYRQHGDALFEKRAYDQVGGLNWQRVIELAGM